MHPKSMSMMYLHNKSGLRIGTELRGAGSQLLLDKIYMIW